LYFAHIFLAGLSSGLYGGRKTKTVFSGMINFFALWNLPLSNIIIFSSFGLSFEKLFRKN
jgi:hypothetical protein